MPKKSQKLSIDLQAWMDRARSEFTGLDPNDPSRWPDIPRYTLLAGIVVVVVAALWYLWLSGLSTELTAAQQQEVQLRQQYQAKMRQAINLELLKQQLEQVQQYVAQLEKQLPSKAEMDALLSDINQAGLGRNLQFELFRPGAVVVEDYYAEQPIAVRVIGGYHDIAMFAADVAALSRIVTLNNLSLAPVANKPNALALDATAKTFRYLDPDELQQKEAKEKQAQKGGKK